MNISKNNQLNIIGSAVTAAMLFFFACYRFYQGDIIQSILDLTLMCVVISGFVQCILDKNMPHLNYISVFLLSLIITLVINHKGLAMIYWVFPGIITNYFLIESKNAIIINFILIAIITFVIEGIITIDEFTSIYPSLILVGIFGYIFSRRNENQNEALYQLTTKDTLTGARNRRALNEKVQEIFLEKENADKPATMLLLDLDHFKNINDTYGHNRGDKILIKFVEVVKSTIENEDLLFRCGGEEFVVIAENTLLEESRNIAEKIREAICNSNSLSKYNVTVSIGVSELVNTDQTETWIKRTDKALYKAKSSGRNRVVCLDF